MEQEQGFVTASVTTGIRATKNTEHNNLLPWLIIVFLLIFLCLDKPTMLYGFISKDILNHMMVFQKTDYTKKTSY